jgi:hypothetical protein
MSTTLIPFDIEAQRKAAMPLINGMDGLRLALDSSRLKEISDQETLDECVDIYNKAAAAEKKIRAFWEPLRKLSADIKDLIIKSRDDMASPVHEIATEAKRRIEVYGQAQLEAKRAADALLLKQAEQNKKTMLKEAEQLMNQGFIEESEMRRRQADIMSSAPALPSAKPQSENAKFTEKWDVKITDLMSFVKGIADGRIPLFVEFRGEQRPLIEVDMGVLRGVVSRQGSALQWPGVEVKETVKVGARNLR